ncbi:MAG: hypothetical protein U0787_10080 [Polyangia bacterium]
MIASLASLRGRLDDTIKALLVLDEAHHANDDAAAAAETAERFPCLNPHRFAVVWCAFLPRRVNPDQARRLDALKAGCARLRAESWEEPRGPSAWSSAPATKPHSPSRRRAARLMRTNVKQAKIPTRIARWKTGQLGLLCANRMLWEGFDEPRCAAVWIDRDTESEIAGQMAGRALRHLPGKTARIYTRTPEQRLRPLHFCKRQSA